MSPKTEEVIWGVLGIVALIVVGLLVGILFNPHY
jgi:uncharacterized membrane protein